MQKAVLFVFNGDPMCFVHVLLNALDMHTKGCETKIVVEGSATKLIAEIENTDHPLHGLWEKCRKQELIDGACKACSQKMGTSDAARQQDLPLLDGMNGHPGMQAYRQQGFEVITF